MIIRNRIILRFGDIRWPPRSLDLSFINMQLFFLWKYLKPRAYEGKPRTLKYLKTAIREKNRFKLSKPRGLQTRIRENGLHLSDVIFHT